MLDASTWWSRVNNHVLESALGLALLLVGLFKVLLPVLGVVGPLALASTTRTVGIDADVPLPDTTASGAVTLRAAGRAELVFHSPGFGDRLLLILPGLVGAVLLLVIFDVLIRLARTFHAGDFFVPRNARRLLVVSGLVFLIGTLPPALDVLTTHLLVDGTPVGQVVHTPYSLDMVAVFGALLIAAAAAAFRQGARLREDVEGLV
ncbi:DUF2975 domain-containing protein [Streptomyces netropsis]|uniref:DUF2975 domain-containing protein n=1 Tax=Streptomyces netropsis TaxID=55404 RepID=A0A7W7LH08_STRNE|nr:DUF2975 domain-containing protein [Streptomyces netropsis]MBB4890055.1 hypothetical protein [Streptomyces netropsis]GGR42342.1 hypothetical protein GCM10010219_54580 [Streptomyces netropsis]